MVFIVCLHVSLVVNNMHIISTYQMKKEIQFANNINVLTTTLLTNFNCVQQENHETNTTFPYQGIDYIQ